jgi:hypothetical protein
MAKDPTDYSTFDFVAPTLHVTRGQVLLDRQRHVAIVARRGAECAHLLRVKSGKLRLVRVPARELVENWSDCDYPLAQALRRLLEHGRQHGMTDTAQRALEALLKSGRDPVQAPLFSAEVAG